jgi:hypothetical protein
MCMMLDGWLSPLPSAQPGCAPRDVVARDESSRAMTLLPTTIVYVGYVPRRAAATSRAARAAADRARLLIILILLPPSRQIETQGAPSFEQVQHSLRQLVHVIMSSASSNGGFCRHSTVGVTCRWSGFDERRTGWRAAEKARRRVYSPRPAPLNWSPSSLLKRLWSVGATPAKASAAVRSQRCVWRVGTAAPAQPAAEPSGACVFELLP